MQAGKRARNCSTKCTNIKQPEQSGSLCKESNHLMYVKHLVPPFIKPKWQNAAIQDVRTLNYNHLYLHSQHACKTGNCYVLLLSHDTQGIANGSVHSPCSLLLKTEHVYFEEDEAR
eukprot:scaffold139383_cov15-Prasinocladus_malaysianus.AAC.1